jgi:hypothetical protein
MDFKTCVIAVSSFAMEGSPLEIEMKISDKKMFKKI